MPYNAIAAFALTEGVSDQVRGICEGYGTAIPKLQACSAAQMIDLACFDESALELLGHTSFAAVPGLIESL